MSLKFNKPEDRKRLLYSLIILITGIIVRMYLISRPGNTYLGGNDALGYHNAAVILTHDDKNIGFFREPGYIYFLAGVYKTFEVFGKPVKSITSEFLDVKTNPEIIYLRVIQAIISALTITLFYLMISSVIQTDIALIICFISSIYLPLANLPLYILRETIQFFILTLLNIALVRYYFKPGTFSLILIGLLWGISNLMLQITYLIFIPYLIAFFFLKSRNPILAMKQFILCFTLMLLVLTPWLIKSYKFYPDLRIIKTEGSSMTYESVRFVNSLQTASELGYMTKEKFEKEIESEWYLVSDSSRFQKSFSGYYLEKTDSLKKLYRNNPVRLKFFIRKGIKNFRLSMLQTFFWSSEYHQVNPIIDTLHTKRIFFVIPFLLFSYLSLIGFCLFWKKLLFLLPIFIFFASLFYLIGNETRRMLIIHPFLIMFSVLFVISFYFYIIKKMTFGEIQNILFIH